MPFKPAHEGLDEAEYQRRIRAWTLYDWANSAFATTILAAVLPIYYSQVAGDTLASASIATAYWTAGLSIALFIVALDPSDRVAAAIRVVDIEQIRIIRMKSQTEQALLPVSGADPIGQVEGHSDTHGMDNTSPLHC